MRQRARYRRIPGVAGMSGVANPLSTTWKDHLASLIAGSPVNLVSRGDRGDLRRIHVDECEAIGRRLQVAPGATWMDVGTGGGLPGLVLAAMFPDTAWTLLDARRKKLSQVDRFVSELGLRNVRTVHGRAEQLVTQPIYDGSFDGVISRALGSIEQVVALSRAFVTDGRIEAVRGPLAIVEAQRLRSAASRLSVHIEAVEEVGGTMRPTWLLRLRGRGALPATFARTRQAILRAEQGDG